MAIVIFTLSVAAYWLFKPTLAFSPPELSYRDGTCIAQFAATNHTDNHIDTVLRTVVAKVIPGDDTNLPTYSEYAHQIVAASFLPREKKIITCELPMPSPSLRANDTRIEVMSYSVSSR